MGAVDSAECAAANQARILPIQLVCRQQMADTRNQTNVTIFLIHLRTPTRGGVTINNWCGYTIKQLM